MILRQGFRIRKTGAELSFSRIEHNDIVSLESGPEFGAISAVPGLVANIWE